MWTQEGSLSLLNGEYPAKFWRHNQTGFKVAHVAFNSFVTRVTFAVCKYVTLTGAAQFRISENLVFQGLLFEMTTKDFPML